MSLTTRETDTIAERILRSLDTRTPIPPLTDGTPAFSLEDAYRVSAAVTRLRVAGGERPVGWKIGFTNQTIWGEYGVQAPIWAPVYDATCTAVDPASPIRCRLEPYVEPRIEPEIVFRVAQQPRPGMDEQKLLACLDGVAHGFEIVQSIFPGWRFGAADTIAAFGLHGHLYHGPIAAIDQTNRTEWLLRLSDFAVALERDGAEVDRGVAANVLGGPLSALRHFVDGLVDDPLGRGLLPGDLVTTGTITRAFPVEPGERWTSHLEGLPLPGLTLAFE